MNNFKACPKSHKKIAAAQQSALLSLQTLYLKAIFHLLHSNFLCRKMFCSALLEIMLQWLYSLMAKTGLLWFYPVYRPVREHKHSFLEYLLCTMKLLQSGTCSFCGNTLPWMSNFFFPSWFSLGLIPREMFKLNTTVQRSPKRQIISYERGEQDVQSLKCEACWREPQTIMSTSFIFKNLTFWMA